MPACAEWTARTTSWQGVCRGPGRWYFTQGGFLIDGMIIELSGFVLLLSHIRYAVGAVLLVMSAIGSTIGLHLLAVSQATARIQPSSFYTVANAAMPRLTVLIDVAVYLKCKAPFPQPPPHLLTPTFHRATSFGMRQSRFAHAGGWQRTAPGWDGGLVPMAVRLE